MELSTEKFIALEKRRKELDDKRIRMEEQLKLKKEELAKVISQIKAEGYDPNKLKDTLSEMEEKLAKDGRQPYSVQAAMQGLSDKIQAIRPSDLAVDLFPLFERRTFIEAWLEGFHANFSELVKNYL